MDQDVQAQATRVELRFPGTAEFLRLARLATADAGTRAGLGVDEIEDLRIAVSELCALVGGEDVEIVLGFEYAPGVLVVDGSGGPGLLDGENADMAQALVRALVDEYEIVAEPTRATFRVRKHSSSV